LTGKGSDGIIPLTVSFLTAALGRPKTHPGAGGLHDARPVAEQAHLKTPPARRGSTAASPEPRKPVIAAGQGASGREGRGAGRVGRHKIGVRGGREGALQAGGAEAARAAAAEPGAKRQSHG